MVATPDHPARHLVDALDEPALVIQSLNVVVANAAARALLGSGVEGRDFRLALRQPDLIDLVSAGQAGDRDVAGIGRFGQPWRVSVRPLGDQALLVRLTDRAEALSAEKIRVDFVANASHELRTPLSVVLGYAETLADIDDDPIPPSTIAWFGATIRDEARRMLGVVEDLMSLSRIEADRFVTPQAAVPVDGVIRAVLANVSAVRGARQCTIDVDLDDALPAVRGDEAQLIQAFDNLVSNALRYGCEQMGSRILVTGRRVGDRVELAVRDFGPGIPREHIPRLTERFYRVDAARSRESGGTGLGLAIVKHIVERHRGTLDIRSASGSGTTVTVTLPSA